MDWEKYFESRSGTGFLATSNKNGEVDIAVYSRPRVMDDGTLVFGMTDRLTHSNLQENPKAVYAFKEGGFAGVRLYLEKVREETGGAALEEVRRSADRIVGAGTGDQVAFLVCFKVTHALNLVGPGSPG
jgi:hypothetical protein